MSKFVKLCFEQIAAKVDFIWDYFKVSTAADASLVDANANITEQNVATCLAELHKDFNIQISRKLNYDEIDKLFGKNVADAYLNQLNNHTIYCHDENSAIQSYCLAITLYPFLTHGLTQLGGHSKSPKHLSSFCGNIVNLGFAISSQIAGALALPEILLIFDYFARKDYGDNYLETDEEVIKNSLQHLIYALNQPAAARGFQSVFLNFSIFDKCFFDGLFENFIFPADNSKPNWETFNKLQKYFLVWMREERTRADLTFPVITVALKTDPETHMFEDEDMFDFAMGELSNGNEFFVYQSDTVDSLSMCCKLRSVLENVKEFSYTLGSVGIMTGSIHVITMNMNRLIQKWVLEQSFSIVEPATLQTKLDYIKKKLREQVKITHKYHVAFREILKRLQAAGGMPVHSAQFITLDKQYSTIGIIGILEACEFLGLTPGNNPEYIDTISQILKVISKENAEGRKAYKCKFNTEMVPGENLGVKFAHYDKRDGFRVLRDVYNSYFFASEDETISPIDKLILHGKKTTENLDGGSACHINLQEHLTKEQCIALALVAAKVGCSYWTFNIKSTACNDCEYIDVNTLKRCSKCGSTNIDYLTRIIGYRKRVKHFSQPRRVEEGKRAYSGKKLWSSQ